MVCGYAIAKLALNGLTMLTAAEVPLRACGVMMKGMPSSSLAR